MVKTMSYGRVRGGMLREMSGMANGSKSNLADGYG